MIQLAFIAAVAMPGPAVRAATPLPARDNLAGVVLWDLMDRPVRLSSFAGKVVVLVHEDRDSGDKNQAVKRQLGRLWERYQDRMVIVAVAEVSKYDFWPARHYVKEALRKLGRTRGAFVLCDWKGALRQRFGLQHGDSSLFILGPDGRIAMARRGALDPGEAQVTLQHIEGLLPHP